MQAAIAGGGGGAGQGISSRHDDDNQRPPKLVPKIGTKPHTLPLAVQAGHYTACAALSRVAALLLYLNFIHSFST